MKNLAGLDAKYRYTNSHRYTFAHIHTHFDTFEISYSSQIFPQFQQQGKNAENTHTQNSMKRKEPQQKQNNSVQNNIA